MPVHRPVLGEPDEPASLHPRQHRCGPERRALGELQRATARPAALRRVAKTLRREQHPVPRTVQPAPIAPAEEARVEAVAVRRLDQQHAVVGQAVARLGQHRAGSPHVLDQVEHGDKVESARIAEVLDARKDEVVPGRPRAGLRGGVDVDDDGGRQARLGPFRLIEQPAGAAADIERGEPLAGDAV